MDHNSSGGAGNVSIRAATVGDVVSATAPVSPTIRTVSVGVGCPGTALEEAQPESVTSDIRTVARMGPAGRGESSKHYTCPHMPCPAIPDRVGELSRSATEGAARG